MLVLLTTSFFIIESQQLPAQENAVNKANELFENDNYEEALPLYKNLIKLDPLNEQINYNYGVCLTETGNFSDEAQRSLNRAKLKFPKAFLYLGKYYQANSQWGKAIENYNRFKDSAKRKEINKTYVNKFIIECQNKTNTSAVFYSQKTKINKKPSQQFFNTETDTVTYSNSTYLENKKENPEGISDSIINFHVNARIIYFKVSQFKFDSSKKAFIEGWLIEQKMNNKLRQLQKLRDNYDKSTNSDKEKNGELIMQLEKETYMMNQEINKNYLEANIKESSYWEKAKEDEIISLLKKNRSIEDSLQLDCQKKNSGFDIQVDTIFQKIITEKEAKAIAEKEIKEASEKIVYKIQIGAYKRTPPQWVLNLFKRLSMLRRIDKNVDEKGITVYSVGELNTYEDALQMQKQIKKEGINHAIIAAYKNGKRISINDAKTMTRNESTEEN